MRVIRAGEVKISVFIKGDWRRVGSMKKEDEAGSGLSTV